MPTVFRHRLRFLRRLVWYVLAIAVVCVAVVLGVASQLLPLAEQHPDRVAAWLSQQVGRPVQFQTLKTEWTRRGPLLQLEGLQIGTSQGGKPLNIGQASVLVSLYSGLFPGQAFTELRVRNVALDVTRLDDGSWAIRGLSGKTKGDPLDALDGLGELQIVDGKLHVRAPSLGWDIQLPSIDLRLHVQGRSVRLGARMQGAQTSEPIEIAALLDRKSGDGRAYLSAKSIQLADWDGLSSLIGSHLTDGQGSLQAWVELKGRKLSKVQTELSLQSIKLSALDGSGSAHIAQLQGQVNLQIDADHWQVDVPALQLGELGKSQKISGLTLVGGKQIAVLADEIQIAPLLQGLAVQSRIKPTLRHWLLRAKPDVSLSNVSVAGNAQGPLQLEAKLNDLAFLPVENIPGLSGLGGTLTGDRDGVALVLDSSLPFQFDWPAGFGVVHPATLQGTLAAWRKENGWVIGSPALMIDGPDYGVTARADMWFQNDGTHPWLNAAVDVHDAELPTARGFWVRYLMPESVREWLDHAVQNGSVLNGTGLIGGDLDHWPFLHHEGIFDAQADIANGQIRFQPDWPDMTAFNGHLRFLDNGFSLSGEGQLDDVPVKQITAEIESWHDAILKISANGGDESASLLALLRHSPLQKTYGKAMEGLDVKGPATVDFNMTLPMHLAAPEVIGQVHLAGVDLSDSTYKLAFSDTQGVVSYTHDGFDTGRLSVLHNGLPSILSLRAGSVIQNPAHIFEAQLQAPLTSDELLQEAPALAWMTRYLEGQSPWTVNVAVGATSQSNSEPPITVTAKSDLLGTALNFPAPFNKTAKSTLPTAVTLQLPLDKGQADVNLGGLLALRVQEREGNTGVQVELGRNAVTQPVPKNGLNVSGSAHELDMLGWVEVARTLAADANTKVASSTSLAVNAPLEPNNRPPSTVASAANLPFKLNDIDIQVQKLLLVGSNFPNTRVQATPANQALDVKLSGDVLAGGISVPSDSNGTINAQLERLYWVSAGEKLDSSTHTAIATPSKTEINPADIPPLSLKIDDSRVSNATFGETILRTQRRPDGLHIETLRMQTPQQTIDVTGDWTGIGDTAKTHLVAQFSAKNIGALMSELGFGGRLRDGSGDISLDVAWPSSPADFSLGQLQGSMHIDTKNGALLDVEPGAGRLLGLLSLAQLPRRLTLDFRDFFSKGLAFNQFKGDVAFADGKVHTDNLVLEGPAAEIHISGSTNLREQVFDQTIRVLPHSGNVLAVVGAVAAGPIGAAVGAAANVVLSKPLSEIGAKTYHVSGPWDAPKIEVIDAGAEVASDTSSVGYSNTQPQTSP